MSGTVLTEQAGETRQVINKSPAHTPSHTCVMSRGTGPNSVTPEAQHCALEMGTECQSRSSGHKTGLLLGQGQPWQKG